MIKMQIIGHLGKDCIVNDVNGKKVINFNVAHSERFKDSQGMQVERTTWVNCAYWTDRTGIAPYLVKGQLVYVEGTPDAEAYTNKEGQPAANLRMRVFSVQLLGKSENAITDGQAPSYNAGSSPSSQPASGAPAPSMPAGDTDDLPF